MNAMDLMFKAHRAVASAKVLLDAGDADGACNRAYYAMFDAARFALLASGAQGEAEVSRTDSGLISAFSLHLVKTGQVSVELGKSLNKVQELRLIADYKGDPIENEDAAWAVTQAQVFVEAMQAFNKT
ncbi:MAG TPA: HEPN domain-containing protein [Rhodocyclaceae bacterium]|nr:HEPN domain-containing protein [Rhodocyclaceae bacterium]